MPVYIMGAARTAEMVKIGWTTDIEQRLKHFQTYSSEIVQVLRLIDCDYSGEKWMHDRYALLRMKGEWFLTDHEMFTVEMPARKVRKRRHFGITSAPVFRMSAIQARRAAHKNQCPSTTNIIDLWPSIEAFAGDAGITPDLARVWISRRSVPVVRWSRIEAGAMARGIQGASASDLARLAEAKLAAVRAHRCGAAA